MKKRKLLILSLLAFTIFSSKVSAKENFYTNKNNVTFTEQEYTFLTKMYWEGSQDLFTQENYNDFINSNIMNGEFEMFIYEPITLRSTSITDSSKTLKISKSCSTSCLISVTSSWNKIPSVRSYDIIGARFENTSLINTPTTTIISSGSTSYGTDLQLSSNGFGVTAKLPTTGTNIVINQTYKVNKGGTVYASYQHAKMTVTLNDSKKYSISSAGYGKVFRFDYAVTNKYDAMNGVSIAV